MIGEERAEFERAYQHALAEAADSLDLTRVLDVLRAYRRIAWLTRQQGLQAHRRMLDKAATILRTGQHTDAVSNEQVQALIEERLGQQPVDQVIQAHTALDQIAARRPGPPRTPAS